MGPRRGIHFARDLKYILESIAASGFKNASTLFETVSGTFTEIT